MILKLFTIVMISMHNILANEYLPAYLLKLDSIFTHHVMVVEKSTHKLFIYENEQGIPKLLKTYKVATGKIKGNKQVQGDHKTPEGIYQFQNFHSAEQLIEKYGDAALIYGAGAFTMNYPNIIDIRDGKTGGGIWLHSTDDDKRVDKGLDSRGCVVAANEDLKEISKYINLKKTPVIVVQNQEFLESTVWEKARNDIYNVINTWANSWRNKDFKNYIEQYSMNFYNQSRGNFLSYKRYKRAVFNRSDKPEIKLENISILNYRNYAVVTMTQDYQSDIIQDLGKKVLYLERDADYNWKILTEDWYKLNEQDRLGFTPEQRFFKTSNDNENTYVEAKTEKVVTEKKVEN